jgi:hypothetical protein
MQFSMSILVGIVLGVLVLVFASRRGLFRADAPPKPTPFDWLVLAVGACTFLILVTGMLFNTRWFPLPSIILASASVVMGVGALIKKHRRWQVWVGLVLGGLPMLFWLLFALGYLLDPNM